MMTNLESKLGQNSRIDSYLSQLSELTYGSVSEEQLSSINEVERLKEIASKLEKLPKSVFEIKPIELKQDRFKAFIAKLKNANTRRISIWLEATSYCGTYYLENLNGFKFEFDFAAIPEGVIVLLTEDGSDELLLDFDTEVVEIELCGTNWGSIEY